MIDEGEFDAAKAAGRAIVLLYRTVKWLAAAADVTDPLRALKNSASTSTE